MDVEKAGTKNKPAYEANIFVPFKKFRAKYISSENKFRTGTTVRKISQFEFFMRYKA